jgi:hypothetical protein
MTDITIEMKFFRRIARYNCCDHRRKEEILEQLKVEPVDERLKTKIKLTMTCNKNEQHDAKINAELQTIWMKMTWKRLLD